MAGRQISNHHWSKQREHSLLTTSRSAGCLALVTGTPGMCTPPGRECKALAEGWESQQPVKAGQTCKSSNVFVVAMCYC
jgi:hypothetical protein